MREIKFRIWHKEDKIMIYLDRQWLCDEYSSIAWGSSKEEYDGIGRLPSYPSEDLTQYEVMQYTGLKDKNGKDIYEGDILDSPTNKGMEVMWSDKGKWIVDYKIDKPFSSLYKHKTEQRCWIQGNIHENSELLNNI